MLAGPCRQARRGAARPQPRALFASHLARFLGGETGCARAARPAGHGAPPGAPRSRSRAVLPTSGPHTGLLRGKGRRDRGAGAHRSDGLRRSLRDTKSSTLAARPTVRVALGGCRSGWETGARLSRPDGGACFLPAGFRLRVLDWRGPFGRRGRSDAQGGRKRRQTKDEGLFCLAFVFVSDPEFRA
jgi:hypothetical protein